MDEFNYLSVFLSIIIGLAVAEILAGIRGRLLAGDRVRKYWPTQLWAATLLLISAQTWWAMFSLRDRHNWEFSGFMVLLGQTIVLYLIAGIVYPDFHKQGEIDLREHYFAQRPRPFRSPHRRHSHQRLSRPCLKSRFTRSD
jgi:hypothetical protein